MNGLDPSQEPSQRRPPRGIRIRGIVVDEMWIVNPVTGRPVPFRRMNATVSPRGSGAVAIVNSEPAIQCYAGDVIESGRMLAFCKTCSLAVCPRHSVICPFCGAIYCLPDSRILDTGGIVLRLCYPCYSAMRDGWIVRAVKMLLGRR